MDKIGDILEYKHGCSPKSVFSTVSITRCPLCLEKLTSTVQPVRHSPPGYAISAPRSVCVTVLAQVRQYSENTVLHVGLSDSKGRVCAMDERGVRWSDRWMCLSFTLDNEMNDNDWDAILAQHCDLERVRQYHPITNNCLSFVTMGLNRIQLMGKCDHTVADIADNCVRPVLSPWEEHTKMYRLIKKSRDGYIMGHEPSLGQQRICDGCDTPLIGVYWHCLQCDDFDQCIVCHDTKPHPHTMATQQ